MPENQHTENAEAESKDSAEAVEKRGTLKKAPQNRIMKGTENRAAKDVRTTDILHGSGCQDEDKQS